MKICEDEFLKHYGQCNAFSLGSKIPYHTPFSIKTIPSSNLKDNQFDNQVVVRNCPYLGWFQAIETPIFVKVEDCSINQLPRILLRIDVILEILENPIGGLIYADKLHFEGLPLNSRFLEVGGPIGQDNGGKRSDYKHSILKIFHQPQIEDGAVKKDHFIVTIEIDLKHSTV